MKEDASAPTREPAGMAAVMPPCRYERGELKYLLYAVVPSTPDMLEISNPNRAPPRGRSVNNQP